MREAPPSQAFYRSEALKYRYGTRFGSLSNVNRPSLVFSALSLAGTFGFLWLMFRLLGINAF